MSENETTVHRCPPPGSGLTPCCGKTPFELPRGERVTVDPRKVTCRGDGRPALRVVRGRA